jgi:hypothetical protein
MSRQQRRNMLEHVFNQEEIRSFTRVMCTPPPKPKKEYINNGGGVFTWVMCSRKLPGFCNGIGQIDIL